MKRRTFKEWILDIIVQMILPFIKLYLKRKYKIKREYENFSVKENKKKPYILICNHVQGIDALIVAIPLKRRLRFLTNTLAYFNKKAATGLKLTQMIEIRKGGNDITALRSMISSLKKGYSLGFAPEGSMSFYGDTGYIPYSTAKLLKKLKTDIIACNIKGGYLSKPRWSNFRRKKGRIELSYRKILKGEELNDMSVDEVYDIVKSSLQNNDYKWQDEKKFKYKCFEKAVGIERVIYACPTCRKIATIYGMRNMIVCSNCGVIGRIDAYEKIRESIYSNLIDWRDFQRSILPEISFLDTNICISVSTIDYKKMKKNKVGQYYFKYKDKKLFLKNEDSILVLNINQMEELATSFSSSIIFDYENKTYELKTEHIMLVWDLIMFNRDAKMLGNIENYF